MASLVLSDGTRSYDFLAEPVPAVYVQADGLNLPVVSREDTFAEGSDSEGRTRVRSRALNSEAGSFSVFFKASNANDFWDAVDNLQELVESAHRNKGTLTYTPPGGVAVTFDLEAIGVTDLPQRGVDLRQFHGEATVSFESKPYGRLAPVNIGDSVPYVRTNLAPRPNAQATGWASSFTNFTSSGSGLGGGAWTPGTGNSQWYINGTATAGSATALVQICQTAGNRAAVVAGQWYHVSIDINMVARGAGAFRAGFVWLTGAGAFVSSSTQDIVGLKDERITWRVQAPATAALFGFQVGHSASLANGETCTFSVADFMVEDEMPFVADLASEMYDDFAGKADGALTTTDSGHPWGTFNNNGDEWRMRIADEASTHIATNASAAAGYSEVELPGTCSMVGAEFYFKNAGGATNGGPTLFISKDSVAATALVSLDMSAHLPMTRTGWTFDVWVNGVQTNLASGSFSSVLSANVDYSAQLRIAGDAAYIELPDGTSRVIRDSRIASAGGPWPDWECYEGTASTGSIAAFRSVWSDSRVVDEMELPGVGFFPTPAQVTAGDAVWTGTSGASTSTYTALLPSFLIDLAGPIDDFTVAGVPGHVPAWGELIGIDASSQARNHVEVGVQHDFDPDNPEPILLQSVVDLTALGGSSNTRSGSYATNIIRAALTTSPVAVCTSGEQPHKGLWKVRARVYPSTTDVRVRLAWRAGDGPFASEKWVRVPNSAGWYDLDLGTVNIGELPSGHTAEFRIEAFTVSGAPTIDIDILTLLPCDNYTKLRGSNVQQLPTAAVVAADDFSTQTSGAVTGKTPLLAPAGNYSGAGDTDDFQVDTTDQNIYRSAVSDSTEYNGRYLRCGSGVLAATTAQVDFNISSEDLFSGTCRYGVFLRYVDTSNWLLAAYYNVTGDVVLYKRVAGTVTSLGSMGAVAKSGWRTLSVAADTTGNVIVYEGPQGGALTPVILVLADANLATSGALDDGGYGIYDATTGAGADTRQYDNFVVWTTGSGSTILNPAINSGQGLLLAHDTALTDNSDGTSIGTTPIREGKYLTLPVATRNSDKSRIVVRARRDDVDSGFADSGLTDSLTAQLSVTPRVHLTGN